MWDVYKQRRIATMSVLGLIAFGGLLAKLDSGPAVGPHAPALSSSATMITKHEVLGCKAREDADKLLDLVLAKDWEAVERFTAMRTLSGACQIFKGEQVLTIEHEAFSDAICMRAQGDVDCYWINKGWLR